MNIEFEIKFLNIDEAAFRSELEKLNAKKIKDKFLMRRKVLHFPDSLSVPNKWARVRDEGDKITASIKHVVDPNSVDGTKEVEIIVNGFKDAVSFLEEIGLNVTSYQENYREKWHYKDCEITIDTWPGLKPFVEIEGPNEDKVNIVVNDLKFDKNQGEFGRTASKKLKVLWSE